MIHKVQKPKDNSRLMWNTNADDATNLPHNTELKHASNCHSGSSSVCHESKRTLGNGTGNRYPRADDRGVLLPRPCLWPRDLLIAVLCGQVALLRIAALLAGITQGAAPPKSAIVVAEGRPLYTILVGMYGGLWLQKWEQSPWAVGRKPLLSSKVQPSLPDRYGPTSTFA